MTVSESQVSWAHCYSCMSIHEKILLFFIAERLRDEAIRSASSENMNEIEKMIRMNRSLIDALAEEKAVRQRLEEKLTSHGASFPYYLNENIVYLFRKENIDEVYIFEKYNCYFCYEKDDLATLKTQCDIELDSARIEIMRLRSQLRAVCEEKSLADIYSIFESNISRLLKENEALRRANLDLETKELEKAMAGEKPSLMTATGANSQPSYLLEVANKENNRLLLKLKKSGQEKELLREQLESYRMRERQYTISNKLAQDSSRRLKNAHQV